MAGVLLGCSSQADEEEKLISRDEALAVLKEVQSYADKGDIASLCKMNDAEILCQRHFREAGGLPAIPTTPPEVTDEYVLPAMGAAVGGRVLVLSGKDGMERPYRSEFLVFHHTGRLVPQNPIYWSGIGLALPNEAVPQR